MMNRRSIRTGVALGALASGAVALARNLASRPVPAPTASTLRPDLLTSDPVVPSDQVDVAAAPGADWAPAGDHGEGSVWVDAGADGTCPASHPVKAKLSSRIFHLPGMLNYDRTRADRCYLDTAAAEADGLRVAKR